METKLPRRVGVFSEICHTKFGIYKASHFTRLQSRFLEVSLNL